MGKVTYKRVTGMSRPQAVIATTLPVIGSGFYVFGSFFFWPSLQDWALNLAAALFTIGALFFTVAPVLDYLDMLHVITELDAPPLPEDPVTKANWLYLTQAPILEPIPCRPTPFNVL